MHITEQTNHGVTDLYWLAYLLTGNQDTSIDLAIATISCSSQEGASLLFSTAMQRRSRRAVISRGLAAIRHELTASARRTELESVEGISLPPRTWALHQDTSKLQLERAMLAMDLFPRAVILLLVLEGLAIEDAEVLLDAPPALIRKGQMVGLRELTRNLARVQGWTSIVPPSSAVAAAACHA